MPHPETALATIGEVARGVVPGARVLLFGSHARREARPESDYDILVIAEQPLEAKRKLTLPTQIRKQLLARDIRCNVLLQSEHETQVKKDLPGHVVRAALREGVPL
jgi:uncharacterized protein